MHKIRAATHCCNLPKLLHMSPPSGMLHHSLMLHLKAQASLISVCSSICNGTHHHWAPGQKQPKFVKIHKVHCNKQPWKMLSNSSDLSKMPNCSDQPEPLSTLQHINNFKSPDAHSRTLYNYNNLQPLRTPLLQLRPLWDCIFLFPSASLGFGVG